MNVIFVNASLGELGIVKERKENLNKMILPELEQEFMNLLKKLNGEKYFAFFIKEQTEKEYIKKILLVESYAQKETHFHDYKDAYEQWYNVNQIAS